MEVSGRKGGGFAQVTGSHTCKMTGLREGAFSFNASFMHRLWLFLSVLTHPRDHWKKDKTKQKKREKGGKREEMANHQLT